MSGFIIRSPAMATRYFFELLLLEFLGLLFLIARHILDRFQVTSPMYNQKEYP